MSDAKTIGIYDKKAGEYAELVHQSQPDKDLTDFIDMIPKGGRVLDLGCGPAAASHFMKVSGLDPDPVDASQAMVDLANETFAINARRATFDDIEGDDIYAGVWANFSLLHADRSDLPDIIKRLVTALKTGGAFHIGMKTGNGTSRDKLGRRYTYVGVDELQDLLTQSGLTLVNTREGTAAGLDGSMAPFVICKAIKNG